MFLYLLQLFAKWHTFGLNLLGYKSKNYLEKVSTLSSAIKDSNGFIVKKNSNHVFGLNTFSRASKIDMSHFTDICILAHTFTKDKNYIEVESSVTIKQVLDYLIPKGYILNVIPDMSHLTMGGIISGIGGGSASFRYGYFHESLLSFEMVLGDGTFLHCSRSENEELFYAVPNLLGTLGYITKLTIQIRQCKPYVETTNMVCKNAEDFFDLLQICRKQPDIDFLDGTIFGESLFILVVGTFCQKPNKKPDNFINDKIYWKSITTEKYHVFKTIDYIYRWDTDLYYTSMNIPQWLNNPKIRRLVPKKCINLVKKILPYLGVDNDIQDIVQDVLIPFKKAKEFYEWYDKTIGLYPVYICPAVSAEKFTFWNETSGLCDFGIGYGVEIDKPAEKTQKIEQEMMRLGGKKLLYTKTRLTEDEFWSIYDKTVYQSLRSKYNSRFPNLYEKIKAT